MTNFKDLKIKIFILGVLTSLFLTETFLEGQYNSIKSLIYSNKVKVSRLFDGNSYENYQHDCLPELIHSIPDNISVIIGHAYGRNDTFGQEPLLNPKIDNFLSKYKNEINTRDHRQNRYCDAAHQEGWHCQLERW